MAKASYSFEGIALFYHAIGFNVLPIGKEKKPLIEWVKWQTERQTEDDLAAMGEWARASGVGAVSGKVSGDDYLLDFDDQINDRAVKEFLEALDLPPDYQWLIKTGKPYGHHIWLRSPGLDVRRNTRDGKHGGKIELRGNGHQALLPPSLHPSGKRYQFVNLPAGDFPTNALATIRPERLLAAYDAITIQPEKPAPPPPDDCPYDTSDRDYSGYIRVVLEREFEAAASAGKSNRNNSIYTAGLKLYGFEKSGLITKSDVDRVLITAADKNGVLAEDGEIALHKTLASAYQNADPRRPKTRAKRVKRDVPVSITPIIISDQTADQLSFRDDNSSPKKAINLRYISDMDLSIFEKGGAFILKSQTGSGKTELINQLITRLENKEGHKLKTVVLNHRRMLSSNTSKRLSSNTSKQTVFEDYQNIPRESRRIFDDLVLCVNSLAGLQDEDNRLPEYEVVVIDEIEQVLSHILGGTFTGNQGLEALSALEHLVKNAKWVIGLDAYAGRTSYRWLRSIRDDLTFIQNTYQPIEKPLNRFSSDSAMLAHIDQVLEQADSAILIACASKKQAKAIYQRYLNHGLNPDEMKLLTSDSKNEQDFIRNINEQIGQYKLLIFSPTMGTGVDLTAPVTAIYGFFTARDRDFTAPDMLQMIGRARNADSYHFELNASPLEEPRPTLPGTIYRAELDRLLNSNRRVEKFFNEHGLKDVSPAQKRLLRLFALVEARRNRSKNDLHADFTRLANGQYTLTENDAPPVEIIKQEMKEIRVAQKEAEKDRLLTAIPVSPDEYAEKSKEATEPELDALAAGLERWHFEDHYGQSLTEALYAFDQANGKQILETCRDLLSSTRYVASQDREEIRADHDGHKRSYRAYKRKLILGAIQAAFGDFKKLGDLNRNAVSEAAIIEGIGTWREANAKDIQRYFKRRSVLSDDPVDLLRWVLKRAGLHLDLVRNCKQAEEGTFYRVSNGSITFMEGLVSAQLQKLEKDDSTRFCISNIRTKKRRATIAA